MTAYGSLADRYFRRASVKMWLVTICIFAIGIALFATYHRLEEPFDELARDIGMAFAIAAIVTGIYEAYARSRAATETFEDILAKIMGDIVDSSIWAEMREQILEKTAVRRATAIQLKVMPLDPPESGRMKLWVGMQYRVSSLRSHDQEVPLLHFLDWYMADPKHKLPRFIRIVVDGDVEPLRPGQHRFEKRVLVSRRGNGDVPVLIEREELIYIPGAYNLIVSDLTELESVALWEAPPAICVHLNCMFDECDLDLEKAFTPGRYILPGQSLEFRFTRRGAPVAAMSDTPGRSELVG